MIRIKHALPVILSSCVLFSTYIRAQDTSVGTLNAPHPDTVTGPYPGETVEQHAHEQLSLSTGALNLFIPILSLPQRGGRPLTLGYVHSSNTWAEKETSVTWAQYGTADASNPQTWWLEIAAQLNYQSEQQESSGTTLNLNIPELHADLVYMGAWSIDNGGLPTYYPSYCVTGWTFTDWRGASHSFRGYRDCTSWVGPQYDPGAWMTITESTDDSGYQIDTTTTSDLRVIGPDGMVYHFTGYTPPANNGGQLVVNGSAYEQLPFYIRALSSMVDPDGNTVTLANGVLTDTTGRQVKLNADGGMSWTVMTSPSAPPSTATVTRVDSNSGVTVPFDTNQVTSCQPKTYQSGSEYSAAGYHGINFTPPYLPQVYSFYNTTLTLPDGSRYQLTYDSMNKLTKVQYPNGGYSRYDYAVVGPIAGQSNDEGDMMCTHPRTAVIARHECTLANGACSAGPTATISSCQAGYSPGGEATTCYGVGGPSGLHGFAVTDPLLRVMVYQFTPEYLSQPNGALGDVPMYIPPLETQRQVLGPDNVTPLRTVSTGYSALLGCPMGTASDGTTYSIGENCLPVASTTTTTFNDVSPAVTATETHQLQYPNLPQLNQSRDFAGDVVASTTLTYESGGIYSALPSPSGGLYHILDHVRSGVSNEKTGKAITTSNTYDAVGNLVQVDRSATGSSPTTTKIVRDTQGNVIQVQDPMQFTSQHSGSTTFGYTNQNITNCPGSDSTGLPTSVTNALEEATLVAYYPDGHRACTQDSNGQITRYSYDLLGRPSETDFPDGGVSRTSYTSSPPLQVVSSQAVNASETITHQITTDGFGRVVQSQLLSGREGATCTETFYDAIGNITATDDPNLICPTANGTPIAGASISFGYDVLNRKISETHEDGSVDQWSYSGPTVTYTDTNTHQWVRTSDAQGRLVRVLEPNVTEAGIGSGSPETDYVYDGFGNLWSTTQKGISSETARNRSFTYDGFSRLLTSSNPETGAICYGMLQGSSCSGGYDLNGNLTAKTDARGITMNYSYDNLNRLVAKTYTNDPSSTPASCYQYGASGASGNSVGRLVAEFTAASCPAQQSGVPNNAFSWKTVASYDPMGRVSSETQCAFSPCANPNPVSYSYDYLGSVSRQSNGLAGTQSPGLYVDFTNDAAGRLKRVTSAWGPPADGYPDILFEADNPINGQYPYGPFGLVTAQKGVRSDTQTAALTESRTYDPRMRLNGITDMPGGTSADTPAATITITPNPLPAGETAVFVTTCDTTCGSGVGTLHMLLDGTYMGGGYYTPGQPLQSRVGPVSSVGSHVLEMDYEADSTHVAQTAKFTFNVVANSLPVPTLGTNSSITINPNPIPSGEPADITVSLPCGANCGQGLLTVDGTWVGALLFDDSGTAGSSLPSTLAVGTHQVKVTYTGDSAYSDATLDTTVQVANPPLPPVQITASFNPTSIPGDEYGAVALSFNCGSNCRGGHLFVDGNYAGGYIPDSNGNTTVGINPGLSIGSHTFEVQYYGDSSYAPNTVDFPFTVVADTAPVPTVSITPNQPTGTAGQSSVVTISVTAVNTGACGGRGVFVVDGTYAGTFFPDGNGNATMTTPVLSSGSHSLQGLYYGTATCAPSPGALTYQAQ